MATATTDLPSLAEAPELHLEDFHVALDDFVTEQCSQHWTEGLYAVGASMTIQRWHALGRKVTDEDGNDTPEPVPTLPAKPAALSGNANAAAVQIHKGAMQRFNDVTQALKETCIADYEKKCIDAEPRTTGNYADLVTHVIAHAPRVTTSSGAMITPPIAPPLLTEREQGYAAGLQAAALQAAGRGGGGRGGGRQAQGRGRGRGDSAPAPLRAYCFVHGTRGHTGAQCRTMAKGAPETHPSFTDEMRAATGPCTIDGYPGASVKA
ncbi:hypothetical protein B484DRAFT_404847 [Ochromonadaceae sp. CCMP2298]|nr:hypothetical protein B484DRAFT_404847 [Ochromonadaceae sp. CCMP2298]